MKNRRPVKNTWYDWLINCIPEAITKIVVGFKGTLMQIWKSPHTFKFI